MVEQPGNAPGDSRLQGVRGPLTLPRGADDGQRSRNLRVGGPALCRLSYVREVVPPSGLAPASPAYETGASLSTLRGRRSGADSGTCTRHHRDTNAEPRCLGLVGVELPPGAAPGWPRYKGGLSAASGSEMERATGVEPARVALATRILTPRRRPQDGQGRRSRTGNRPVPDRECYYTHPSLKCSGECPFWLCEDLHA